MRRIYCGTGYDKGEAFGTDCGIHHSDHLGNIFQQMYNVADTVIVGQFVGVQALAAVGATGTISFLILGFMQG